MNLIKEKFHQKKSLCIFLFSMLLFSSSSFASNPKKKALTYEEKVEKEAFLLGKKMKKVIPKNWEIEWKEISLREIHWTPSFQQGVQLRFVHKTHKLPLPNPQAILEGGRSRTLLLPRRCSILFFPRHIDYRSQYSSLLRIKPARVFAITKKMIVFQPNHLYLKEFPCPKIYKAIQHLFSENTYKKSILHRLGRWKKKMGVEKAIKYKYHLELRSKKKRHIPFRFLRKRYSVGTVLLYYSKENLDHILLKNTTE